MSPVLDRRIPTDFSHVSQYPLRAAVPTIPARVEDLLPIPYRLRAIYDQGQRGACVAFSGSWLMSTVNGGQRYDPWPLYAAAQSIDEWDDTPPGEGTSLRAGFDVLRTVGHWPVVRGKVRSVDPAAGIETNRWAVSVDEIRAAIAEGMPVQFGINWYSAFFRPDSVNGEHWIGRGPWGYVAGGHAILCYGASDRRQAFRLVNSWGAGWPLVWLPYEAMRRLLAEDGEAGIVTDRVAP